MNNRIYFDQASTSFPKPKAVTKAMMFYLTEIGSNVSRSNYQNAYSALETVTKTRKQIADFFDFPTEKNVIFTPNITYALNFVLKGILQPGNHVLISAMEHNAVMRPLHQLATTGVSFSQILCNQTGDLQLETLETQIRTNTKAIVLTAASNVCGTVMPLEQVGAICKKQGLFFIVDSAQNAGFSSISMKKCQIDALAFTGHKGLLGPQGIGGLILTDQIATQMEPIISGGTGSRSDAANMPDFLPDKFEAGTLNIPGIYGLSAGISTIQKTGLTQIRTHELSLTEQFLKGVQQMNALSIVGHTSCHNRTAVVSLRCHDMDEAELAYRLAEQFQIATRVGLHCAPNAHQTLKTYPKGTIRFSFGYSNTAEEVTFTLHAMKQILQH